MMTEDEKEALEAKAELDRQDRELGPAVEELRLKLNDLIRGHRFNPISTLVLLSRVSAGYIHMMEKAGYDEKCQEGSVEERFHFMVQAHLAELDLDEAKKYIERVNENIS